MSVIRFILAILIALITVAYIGIKMLTDTIVESTPLTRTDVRVMKLIIILIIIGLLVCFHII